MSRLVLSLAALALLAASARADLVDPNSLAWSFSTATSGSVPALNNTGGGVAFTPGSGTGLVGPASSITLATIQASSTALSGNPDNVFGDYTLAVGFATSENGIPQSGTLLFTGNLNGTLSSDAGASITNTPISASTQEVAVGSYLFDVTLNYSPPGQPTLNALGAFNASVAIVPGSSTVATSVPEPSALLLGSLALPWVGAAIRRRR